MVAFLFCPNSDSKEYKAVAFCLFIQPEGCVRPPLPLTFQLKHVILYPIISKPAERQRRKAKGLIQEV